MAGVVAGLMLAEAVELVRARAWRPRDLVEASRRRLDPNARALVAAALAAHAHTGSGVEMGWRQEVAAVVRSGPGTDPRRPWFAQHGGTAGWDDETALRQLLTELRSWPTLTTSTVAGAAADGNGDTADSAMLAKVRALLAKAERTEFEHKADAYTAKAQALMARHALDHAVVTCTVDRNRPVVSRIWLDAPYVAAKATLLNAVAAANRCRVVPAEEMGFATVIGEAGDVRATTLLAASLQVQATRAMTSRGSQRYRDGSSRTRSFRQTFLVSFAHRVGERLLEVTEQEGQATPGWAELVPVLAARSRAADDHVEQLFPQLRTREISAHDHHGWSTGRAAADLAQFDTAGAVESPDR